MHTISIVLTIFGIGFLALAVTLLYFYIKARKIAKDTFGCDSLKEMIETQEEEIANTPKAVSGMTSLYLPRLQQDFPELNWVEFKKEAESHLLNHLKNDKKADNPLIHQTELRDYRKASGTCYVIVQSSVEFHRGGKKVQSRFNTTMAYIQDASRMGYESAYSMNCPNCGAPIVQLGSRKICEYCGSGILPVNTRIWSLNKIEEL